MDMDFLKDALGDDLFAQVLEKLNGNESIRLANVANGSYIPKDKYDLERQNVRAQKQQIDELNTKLTELTQKAELSETLRGQLAAMQQTIAQNEAQMQAQRMEYAVRDLVRGSGARNADIVYPHAGHQQDHGARRQVRRRRRADRGAEKERPIPVRY